MPFEIPPLPVLAATLIVIFFAIGIHEYAHCKFADMAGDPTPRMYGRVTLKLWKHFEPVGTLMMVLTQLTGRGIGWGRPAPMNPSKMRNPKWDHFAAVAAGPVSNLAQAVLYAMAFRALALAHIRIGEGAGGEFVVALLIMGVSANLSLFLFNLLPIGPLDGHWLVGILLPPRPQHAWYSFQRRYGTFLLLGLVLFGREFDLLSRVVGPPLGFLQRLLIGI